MRRRWFAKYKRAFFLTVSGMTALVASMVLLMRREGLPVKTEMVDLGVIRSTISVSGVVEPALLVRVTSAATGRVIAVPVREGDEVRQGDALLYLDPARTRASLRRSEAELSSMEADARAAAATLALSEETQARQEQLAAMDLVSFEGLQKARKQTQIHRAQLEAARERARQSRAGLEAAREDLAQTVARAPVSGVVAHVAVEAGEMVTGSTYGPGTTVMRLADLSAMMIRATVDEADIGMARVGQKASVRIDALPDTTFSGVVTRVAGAALEERSGRNMEPVTFPIDIALNGAPSCLKIGMSAQAELVTDTRENVVVAPLQAVMTDQRGPYIFRVVEDCVRRTEVITGLSDDRFVEIRRGLAPGHRIVTGGARMMRALKDGDRVNALPGHEDAVAVTRADKR